MPQDYQRRGGYKRGYQSDKEFKRVVVHTLEESDRFWLGLEKWEISDRNGSRITSPVLAKREIRIDHDGTRRTGKLKGIIPHELDLIVEKYEELKVLMAPDQKDTETRVIDMKL